MGVCCIVAAVLIVVKAERVNLEASEVASSAVKNRKFVLSLVTGVIV